MLTYGYGNSTRPIFWTAPVPVYLRLHHCMGARKSRPPPPLGKSKTMFFSIYGRGAFAFFSPYWEPFSPYGGLFATFFFIRAIFVFMGLFWGLTLAPPPTKISASAHRPILILRFYFLNFNYQIYIYREHLTCWISLRGLTHPPPLPISRLSHFGMRSKLGK